MARHVAAALAGSWHVGVRWIRGLCGVFDADTSPDAPIGFVFGGEAYLKAGPEAVTRYIARGMRRLRPGPPVAARVLARAGGRVVGEPAALRSWTAAAVDAVRRFGKRRARVDAANVRRACTACGVAGS